MNVFFIIILISLLLRSVPLVSTLILPEKKYSFTNIGSKISTTFLKMKDQSSSSSIICSGCFLPATNTDVTTSTTTAITTSTTWFIDGNNLKGQRQVPSDRDSIIEILLPITNNTSLKKEQKNEKKGRKSRKHNNSISNVVLIFDGRRGEKPSMTFSCCCPCRPTTTTKKEQRQPNNEEQEYIQCDNKNSNNHSNKHEDKRSKRTYYNYLNHIHHEQNNNGGIFQTIITGLPQSADDYIVEAIQRNNNKNIHNNIHNNNKETTTTATIKIKIKAHVVTADKELIQRINALKNLNGGTIINPIKFWNQYVPNLIGRSTATATEKQKRKKKGK